jgi:hypothetical protein
MKKLLIFVLLLANCLIGFSQPEFAPIGAEWHYNFQDGMGSRSSGYYLIKSIKDTVIDSKKCKILSQTLVNSKRVSFDRGQSIVYQDTTENKIYRYLYGKFYLLYDFTKAVGDTIVIKEPYSASKYDSIVIVVDRVSVETFSGNIKLKSFDVRKIHWGTFDFMGNITEKLGNSQFLFPVSQLQCDGGCPDELRCYKDDKIFVGALNIPCDTVYTYTNNLNTSEISVFPNPFINSFTIKNGNRSERQLSIDIFNLYGQLILHDVIPGNEDCQINLNGYPRGFYYLTVKTSGKSITCKLIKNSYLP